MNELNEVKEITCIWICTGNTVFATGNSPQEAYNRYRHIAGIPTQEFTACSFYKATQTLITC